MWLRRLCETVSYLEHQWPTLIDLLMSKILKLIYDRRKLFNLIYVNLFIWKIFLINNLVQKHALDGKIF